MSFELFTNVLIYLKDEVDALLSGKSAVGHTHAHAATTGQTADQHHAQAHSLSSHSTKTHSELSGVGADDHHAAVPATITTTGGTANIKFHDIANLADNGVAQLLHAAGHGPDVYGYIMVFESDGCTAIFEVEGGNEVTREVNDPSNVYTPTAGVDGSTNIYFSAANDRYEIENKRGSVMTYHVIEFLYT
jgi:hypothetical protein